MIGNRVRGHLGMMFPVVLSEADLHGYAISEEFAQRSGGELSSRRARCTPLCTSSKGQASCRAAGATTPRGAGASMR